MFLHKIKTSLVLSLLVFLTSCSLLKASSAKQYLFVPKPELLSEQRNRAPFSGYWVYDPNNYFELKKKYQKLYIATVNTDHVERYYEKSKSSKKTKIARIEESKELARYFREKLKLSLANQENKFISVIDQPQEGALEIKLALVKITPTNPVVNAIGTAAGAFVTGGGLIKSLGEGSVEMEGYVAEKEDSNLYEEFADREGQKVSPFSIKDYQLYAHIRIALDDWAMQLAELLSTEPEHTVEDSLPVSINPF